MNYSIEQKRYIAVFMRHIRLGLAQGNQTNSWINSALGIASQGVGYTSSGLQIIQTLSTAVGIAGIIAAPATLGASIGVAGTVIGVAQGGYQFYQMAKRALGSEETTFISDEVLRESATLAFEILFEEVAVSLAMQYRLFIDTKATNAGIDSLAIFAAKEVMQQWLVLTEKKQPISTDALIAPLYKSRHTMDGPISIKGEKRVFGVKTESYYATGVYPLAAIAYLDINTRPVNWISYQRSKTKIEYGYRVSLVIPPQPKYTPSTSSPDWLTISSHLSAEFLIDTSTVTVVQDYLIAKRRNTSTGSLNDYLSNLYGVQLIAACHDTSLQQIGDLSSGDFSYVNFRRADLRGCILTNTQWESAYLTHAFFGNPRDLISGMLPPPLLLNGAQFNEAHLEASFWENTDFSGALFLSASMKGATLNDCQLGTMQHAGCAWDLTQWHGMKVPDSAFLEQLKSEKIARSKLESEVERLSEVITETQAFVVSIRTIMSIVENTLISHAEKIAQLESQIQAMKEPNWPTSPNVPEYIPRPLHALYGAYLQAFENPLLQQTLHYHVELESRPYQSADAHSSLTSELINFELNNEVDIYLLHGDVGSGKSTTARLSQKRLWDAWGKQTEKTELLVPILIELKQVSDIKDFLTETLQAAPYYYTSQQIELLRRDFRFLFIFDGWDECPKPDARCIPNDIQLPLWNAKLLITARSEWLNKAMDAREMLKSNALTSKIYQITESYISPYDQEHIDSYLSKRFASSSISWEDYRDFLQQQEALMRMAISPVMLHILCAILPELMEQHQSTTVYTRVELYETFLNKWFEREINKEEMLKTAPLVTSKQLKQEFLEYTQMLAFAMFCETTLIIERLYRQPSRIKKGLKLFSQDSEKADPWADFFENQGSERLAIIQAQRSCPLSLERIEKDGNSYHRYQFIHKSFMEYAVATVLWDILNDDRFDIQSCTTIWNHRFITEERGVLSFLIERLTASPRRSQLEQYLFKIVLSSKRNSTVSKAASSAITVLNLSQFDFSKQVPNQDLIDIYIPKADLTEARLMNIDCSRMDANGVIFHNAILLGAKLCQANLTNARFLAGESFILCKEDLKAITLHPKNPDIVIYGDGQDIILARISDGFVQQKLIGHSGYITCLACDTDGLLASGSADQTIRIWNLNQGATHIKTLQWPNDNYEDEIWRDGRIQYLALGPNRMLVAGGSLAQDKKTHLKKGEQDIILCFWELDSDVMKKRSHKDYIKSLALDTGGKTITRDSKNILRIWDPKNWETNSLIKLPGVLTYHNHLPITCGPNGAVALGMGKSIEIWQSNGPRFKQITVFDGEEYVACLAFGPDNILVSGNVNGSISVWHIGEEYITLVETFKGHEKTVTSVQFNSIGVLISSSGEDRTIRQWNLKLKMDKNYSTELVVQKSVDKNVTFNLEISEIFSEITKRISDSHRVLDSNNRYASINYIDGAPVMTTGLLGTKSVSDRHRDLPGFLLSPKDIIAARNNDGMMDLALANDGLIDIWYTKNQALDYKVLRNPRIDELFTLFEMHRLSSSENDMIVVGLEDGTLGLAQNPNYSNLSISSIERTKELSELFEVSSLAFGPDGMLAAGQGDGTIGIWRTPTLSNRYLRIKGHAIDFNYPFPTKTYLTKGVSGKGMILRGKLHVRVTSLIFSSEGILISGSEDETVRFWKQEGDSFIQFNAFKGHTAAVECILFRPNGCLITGSRNEVFIWKTKDFHQEPYKIPVGGSRFWLEGSLLWFSHEKNQYMVDLKDFPRRLDWRMATLPLTLWVNGCDITSAVGLSFSTQQLLQERGIIDNTLSEIDEYTPEVPLEEQDQDLTLENLSVLKSDTISTVSDLPLSQYPGRLLNSESVSTNENSGLKNEEKIQEKEKKRTCVIS